MKTYTAFFALLLFAPVLHADAETKKRVNALLEQNGIQAQVFDAHIYVTVGCFGSDREQCLSKAQRALSAAGLLVEMRNASLIVRQANK